MHDSLKIATNGVTSQGKGRPVLFVVTFERAGRAPGAYGVIGACSQDGRISYLNGVLPYPTSLLSLDTLALLPLCLRMWRG